MIAVGGNSKICRAGLQSGDPGKSRCCHSSQRAVCWQDSFLLGALVIVLWCSSAEGVKPTHITEDSLAFRKVD